MDKNSKSNLSKFLADQVEKGHLPKRAADILLSFYMSYKDTMGQRWTEEIESLFSFFFEAVCKYCQSPYSFPLFHGRLRSPVDYYQFGLNFLRPLVDMENSRVEGREHLKKMTSQIEQGDNVIFLANHQSEADPVAISILLENDFPQIVKELISVAGERVTTDPFAIPFSLGCNLLSIYSKRYIDHPPEQKHQKQLHNRQTMELMSSLLEEGGKCIYVAPSGGRDRKNCDGKLEVAPFDPQSIEMFYLMAKKAKKTKKTTHFYPMALATYHLLPPPESIQIELGELRKPTYGAIHLSVGAEIEMDSFPGSDAPNKHIRRKHRSDYIWKLVDKDYQSLSR